MHVRYPKLDYSKVDPFWSPNHEFAQRYNAGSMVPAHLEPYLVKVMIKAKEHIDPKNTKLQTDLAIFIKQEMQHCKQHIAFNRRFAENGYDGLVPLERAYIADYERFLKTKSLRFNVAYSEGFEAMSAISVTSMFEDYAPFLEGADQNVVDLWRWHLAEEFEHREVAYDVLHAICGKNPIVCYFWRIYGLVYAIKHISSFVKQATNYLLETDRQNMSPEQLAQSKLNEKAVDRATKRPALRHILEIISPFYDPSKRKPPKGLQEYLIRFQSNPVTEANVAA